MNTKLEMNFGDIIDLDIANSYLKVKYGEGASLQEIQLECGSCYTFNNVSPMSNYPRPLLSVEKAMNCLFAHEKGFVAMRQISVAIRKINILISMLCKMKNKITNSGAFHSAVATADRKSKESPKNEETIISSETDVNRTVVPVTISQLVECPNCKKEKPISVFRLKKKKGGITKPTICGDCIQFNKNNCDLSVKEKKLQRLQSKREKKRKRRLQHKLKQEENKQNINTTCKNGGNTFKERDLNLIDIGYPTYKKYLKSALWRGIKKIAYKIKGSNCVLCDKGADAIHHRKYDKDTLLGNTYDHLVPLCDGCHRYIEFLPNGRKTTHEKAEMLFCDRMKKRYETPV